MTARPHRIDPARALLRYRPMKALLLALAGVLLCAVPRAGAQVCGGAVSQCRTCHEARGFQAGAAPWHRDHAFADLCSSCHGGDPEACEAQAAHAALLATSTTCSSCHGGKTAALAQRYAEAPPAATPAAPPPAPDSGRGNLVLLGLIIAVGVGGVGLVVATERRTRGRRRARPRLTAYAAGAGLGVVATVSMAVFGHRLSGAGPYQHLSGYLGRLLAPDSVYWKHVVPTGVTWEVIVLLGMLAGALASAVAGRQFKIRFIPETQWSEVFGPSVWKRWLLVFVSCVALELAAGIAGGCTAGLAVSGGAALAPGAFIFMAGMFGGGIPVARLVYRRGRP